MQQLLSMEVRNYRLRLCVECTAREYAMNKLCGGAEDASYRCGGRGIGGSRKKKKKWKVYQCRQWPYSV